MWLLNVGLVVFVGSALLFLYDVVVGNSVLRGIAVNTLSCIALLLLVLPTLLREKASWDPTFGDSLGMTLLWLVLYLIPTGLVITVTGLLFHDALLVGLGYLGAGVFAGIVGRDLVPGGRRFKMDFSDDGVTTQFGQTPFYARYSHAPGETPMVFIYNSEDNDLKKPVRIDAEYLPDDLDRGEFVRVQLTDDEGTEIDHDYLPPGYDEGGFISFAPVKFPEDFDGENVEFLGYDADFDERMRDIYEQRLEERDTEEMLESLQTLRDEDESSEVE
jgi:hypothetical protein